MSHAELQMIFSDKIMPNKNADEKGCSDSMGKHTAPTDIMKVRSLVVDDNKVNQPE